MPGAEQTSEAGANDFADAFDALVQDSPEQQADHEQPEDGRIAPEAQQPTEQSEDAALPKGFALAAAELADEPIPPADAVIRSSLVPNAEAALQRPATAPIALPSADAATRVAQARSEAPPIEARGPSVVPDPAASIAPSQATAMAAEAANAATEEGAELAPTRSELGTARPIGERAESTAPAAERAAAAVPQPIARSAARAPAALADASVAAQPFAAAEAIASLANASGSQANAARARSAETSPSERVLRDPRGEAPTQILETAVDEAPDIAEEIARYAEGPPARTGSANAPALGVVGNQTPMTTPAATFAPGAGVEAVGASAQAADSSPLPPQTVHALPHQIQAMASEGGGTMRMRLSPPELGDVRIQVSLRGTAVDVVIQAAEPAAQLAVMTQREQLADALGSRDLRMEAFDVRGDSDAPEQDLAQQHAPGQPGLGDRSDSGRESARGANVAAESFAARETGPARAAAAARASGGVDLRI